MLSTFFAIWNLLLAINAIWLLLLHLFCYTALPIVHFHYLGLAIRPSFFPGLRRTGDLEEGDRGQRGEGVRQQIPIRIPKSRIQISILRNQTCGYFYLIHLQYLMRGRGSTYQSSCIRYHVYIPVANAFTSERANYPSAIQNSFSTTTTLSLEFRPAETEFLPISFVTKLHFCGAKFFYIRASFATVFFLEFCRRFQSRPVYPLAATFPRQNHRRTMKNLRRQLQALLYLHIYSSQHYDHVSFTNISFLSICCRGEIIYSMLAPSR